MKKTFAIIETRYWFDEGAAELVKTEQLVSCDDTIIYDTAEQAQKIADTLASPNECMVLDPLEGRRPTYRIVEVGKRPYGCPNKTAEVQE